MHQTYCYFIDPNFFPPNRRTADGVRNASHLVVTPPDIFPPPDGVQDVRSARQGKSVKCRATTASSPFICMKAPHTRAACNRRSNCLALFSPNLSARFVSFQMRRLKGLFFFFLSIQEDAVMKYQTAVFFFVLFFLSSRGIIGCHFVVCDPPVLLNTKCSLRVG